MQKIIEFSEIRSGLYKECLREFPHARKQDKQLMLQYLYPQKWETILEVGAGSGFFSADIADRCKDIYVSDPSSFQLEEVHTLRRKNIYCIEAGAAMLPMLPISFDKIWSFGAMHHCHNKTKAFENFQRLLKSDGKLIIVDVLSGSTLANHFDAQVARYCSTGHEVSFLSKEFFESLCYINGFQSAQVIDIDLQWKFHKEKDIGKFLYKLHAMIGTTEEECLRGAKEYLGIEKIENLYYLNWPLSVFMAEKV